MDAYFEVPHFEEGGRVNPVEPSDRLPQAVYSQALDHLVFACVDLVLTHAGQVLLAKRNTQPRPSWWFIGGRMVAGEDPKATAQRKAAQEAHLASWDPARLRCLGVYSTCFATRQQPPTHHGAHSLNITYHLELTGQEKAQLRLRSSEHDTWTWVTLSTVEHVLGMQDRVDAALLRVLQDLERVYCSYGS